jgi:hypothetical protein
MAEQNASPSSHLNPPAAVNHYDLLPEEWSRLEKRRKAVREYEPPKWVSNHVDVVSGRCIEQSMVDHASILQHLLVW